MGKMDMEDEILRKEKRKVFWKLYTLPWLLLTLTLSIVCVILAHKIYKGSGGAVVDRARSDINEVRTIRTYIDDKEYVMEIERLKRAIHTIKVEAVSNGVGRWEVDIEGESSFKWRTNLVEKAEAYSFTIGDMGIARGRGLDIEGELIKGVDQVIRVHFLGKDEKGRLNLESDVNGVIKGLFEGLETYKRGI